MYKTRDRNVDRVIRHARVRKRISGTPEMPRLCVYRSLNNIYAQVIDDTKGVTLVAASTQEKAVLEQIKDVDKKGAAKIVGKLIAERATGAGIKQVVFDRGGYVYTGRVAELAAGAREAGLEF
ncbi:MAG TPA: 50S ribosomal protein L18 [Candidatus Limiplasma sp.]|nr:50S ribosomal protein L18 [Candidatus Limiplasma sp.]